MYRRWTSSYLVCVFALLSTVSAISTSDSVMDNSVRKDQGAKVVDPIPYTIAKVVELAMPAIKEAFKAFLPSIDSEVNNKTKEYLEKTAVEIYKAIRDIEDKEVDLGTRVKVIERSDNIQNADLISIKVGIAPLVTTVQGVATRLDLLSSEVRDMNKQLSQQIGEILAIIKPKPTILPSNPL